MKPNLDKNQHSVYSLTYHLVLVTKYRKQVINPKIYSRLREIFQNIGRKYNIHLQESNYETDHINFLFKAKPDTVLLKFINSYKSASSRLIKKEYPEIKEKLWKGAFWKIGYFISTTCGVNIETIRKNIERQQKK
ncbi:MAG: IS200/IS605 family transposase, partial [Methanobacterium sp.]|nr:IS200/IS605 family transposase [Methanobacterium sp.]